MASFTWENEVNTILEGPINDALTVMLAEIDAKQAQAKSRNGRYLQALASHEEVPADGISKNTRRMRKPIDQAKDLNLVVPSQMPVRMSVSVYEGPRGEGYEVVGEARVSGQLYRRVTVFGPERYLEQAWVEVLDELDR